MHRFLWIGLNVVLAAAVSAGDAEDDAVRDFTSGEERARLETRLDDEIAQLSARIEKMPRAVDLYSERGDRLFFRGRFAEAVADYDEMVELKPDLETSHWRRGIAYFYAGRYDDAARQFEVYHTFDNIDRENGIWRYLSQVKSVGKERAREGLLKYEKDDREPFPDLYEMFAGRRTGAQVLEAIRGASLEKAERERRLFYAELYVGLNEFVDGKAKAAEEHLREAVRNAWGANAGGGPGYMWHVARVHHNLLREARRKDSSPAPGQ